MDYQNLPIEKFNFADKSRRAGDKKLETKPVSYAKDVWIRFCKNKSSVVAACIILILVLYAIFVPIFCSTTYSDNLTDTTYLQYTKMLPKSKFFSKMGFWDGCSDKTMNRDTYNYWQGIAVETGYEIMPEIYRANYEGTSKTTTYYDVKMDSYIANGMTYFSLTEAEFKDIQKWQNETGIQVIYPAIDLNKVPNAMFKSDANIWYENNEKGAPILDENGNYVNIYLTSGNEDGYDSLRIEGDDGTYRYAQVGGTSEKKTYSVRVFKYTYFQYRYGFEPSFLFGTTETGQDLLTRLAAGARFSLVIAVSISFVNLFLGAIIGAIEGYYGGVTDIVIERIIDVLGGIPFMIVVTLFRLHFAKAVGPVWSMVFAFILTGWIGMAARTRMQFYRFKRQEYVLAARTLGANDRRLMFKHIFPNAMGTLITGSVLSIPGVIFSESSLTYLGIVNLSSSTQTSVGTLLSNGKNMLSSFPHVILFPALFISLLMISFNLFGNGLRDAFNPSLKGVED